MAPPHTVRLMGSCQPSGIEPLSWLFCRISPCMAAGMRVVFSRLRGIPAITAPMSVRSGGGAELRLVCSCARSFLPEPFHLVT